MKGSALFSLLLSAGLLAAPPTIDVPPEIKPTGDYATFAPDTKTTAKAITYVGLSGVDPFPSEMLRDPRAFVVPVRGLAPGRYEFRAVGSLNDEHAIKAFAVIVGTPAPTPLPPTVPPTTPTNPAPAGVAKHLTFVTAGAEGLTVINDGVLRNWLKVGGIAVHVLNPGDRKPNWHDRVLAEIGAPCFVVQDAGGRVLAKAKVTTSEAVEDVVEPLFETPLFKKGG